MIRNSKGQFTSEGMLGQNNPSKRPEIRALLSEQKKGSRNPHFGKTSVGMSGKQHKPETIEKMRSYIGEKRYNYIKDRSKLAKKEQKHLDSRYKEWMLAVKRRDGWKCRIGKGKCKGRLEAHHILPWRDYPECRYEVNNGITLCHAHHPKKRKDEAELSPYFQTLVAEMNYFG